MGGHIQITMGRIWVFVSILKQILLAYFLLSFKIKLYFVFVINVYIIFLLSFSFNLFSFSHYDK